MFAVKNWPRFAALTAFVCALALAGCGKKDEPTKAEGDPKPVEPEVGPSAGPSRTTQDSLAKVKPDVILTPKNLLEEAKKDPFALVTKYAGKVVEVSGLVESLQGRGRGSTYVVLRGGENYGESPFRCDVTEENLAAKVLPSQTAVLRIRAPQSPDRLGTAVWEIVEVKGTVPAFAAEQFVRELASADEMSVKKKYDEQSLILTGVISKVETGDDGTRLFLRGNDKINVECWFPGGSSAAFPFSQNQKANLKPGQTVKVCGRFSHSPGLLRHCILLESAP